MTKRAPVVALTVVVGVVALAAVVLIVWVAGGRADDDGAGATVQRLVDAVAAGDCAGMEAATTPEYREDAHLDCDAVAESAEWLSSIDAAFTVGEVTELSESRADVAVELAYADGSGEPEGTVFTVEREDGRWLVVADSDS